MELKDLSIDQLLEGHKEKYQFFYYSSGAVPAAGQQTFNVAISADAHFLCTYITGDCTSLAGGAGADGGQILTSCQIFDNGRNLNLFDAAIPLNLFLSPGRTRSSGVAGDPSIGLFFPIEFNYLFFASSTIRLVMTNAAADINTYRMCFHGYKYRVNFDQE
jgi:hypothetical protein